MLLEKLTFADDFPINITIGSVVEDPLHYHLDIEFVYVLRGEIQLKNGYCIYDLHEGDIFTNSGNEVHSMRAVTEDNIIAQIQISIRDFSQYFPNLSKACYRTYSKKPDDRKRSRLKDLMLQILLKHQMKGLNYKSECVYLMTDVIKHLDKYFNLFVFDKNIVVGYDRGNQLTVERISRICQYIYQNYPNNITLQDLSEMEYLNSFYLSHLIKDFTGMNFREFLCFARVEMSEISLLGSDKKISQIARETGFSTTAYYKKYFTKWFGHSPQEHRVIYLPQVKSDLRPAVINELPPNRAVSVVKKAHSNYHSQKSAGSVMSSLNLDVNVDVNAKPLRRFDRNVEVVVTQADYQALGPYLFEALTVLSPARVILSREGATQAELRKLRTLVADSGLTAKLMPEAQELPRPECRSYAFDSIVYPVVLFRQHTEREAQTITVFLRDTDGEGKVLQGQPSLLTASGVKKPSFYAYAALSRVKGDIILQSNQYCVVRNSQNRDPFFVVFAYNHNDALQSICVHETELLETRNTINNFRDELNVNISLDLKRGTYSVVKYSLARENTIFAHFSALDFRDDMLTPYARADTFSGWPTLETYSEEVRTVLNMNFALKGAGIQMALLRLHSNQ